MRIFKNPTKTNSYLMEVNYQELQYLKSYFRDMACSESEVKYPASSLRCERFQRYYNSMLKVLPQSLF